jgi:septum formation protein
MERAVQRRARRLVLGSASPRRREMVAALGVPFVVRVPHVDETPEEGEDAGRYVERVVDAKLAYVRAGDVGDAEGVLVADTVVIAPGGGILGKPRDDGDARAMLSRLSGAAHRVSTRFVLAPAARDAAPWDARTVTTDVVFRALGLDEIDAYVATGEGRDKAGAYAVQGAAAGFVVRIEGSYTAIVGLPLAEVFLALRSLGWLGPQA